VYGIILIRLVSVPPPNPRPHNWPFLGVYLLSSVTNATLLVLALTTPPPPQTTFDYAHILIGATRTLLFLSCAVVSEILRVRPISVPDVEVAAASTLLKANGNGNRYGTFDGAPPAHGAHGAGIHGGFGSNPPPKGGWITYVRSFKVGLIRFSADSRCSSHICGRVPIGICKVSWSFVSVRCFFHEGCLI